MQTKYITIDREDFDASVLSGAAEVIREGGLVAFPTETVYGLGADAANPEAAKKIYEAKGRPSDNPLIVHIAAYEQLLSVAEVLPIWAKQLADAFWPGPLTMIVTKNSTIPDATTGGLSTIAVRMPNALIALELIRQSGCMIAAPSANLSGRPSPTRFAHVKEDMDGRADVIIDGGDVVIGIESTIIDLTGEIPTILRPGYITAEQIAGVIGEVRMDSGLSPDSNEPPKAPGMRYRHYAPRGRLTVIEGDETEVIRHINRHAKRHRDQGEKVGVIAMKETADAYVADLVETVGRRDDEDSIAGGLYASLREMDAAHIEIIYTESLQTPRLGDALMNRLLKAAGYQIRTATDNSVRVAGDRKTAVKKVIFASGNGITRAPMAAAVFKCLCIDKKIEAESRGLVVQFAEPMNQKTEAVMISNGISWDDFSSQELTAEDITPDSYVFVMSEKERERVIARFTEATEENTFVLSDYVGDELEIMDPYGGSLQTYGICFEVIRASVEKLINLL